jgi:hypothetical protein
MGIDRHLTRRETFGLATALTVTPSLLASRAGASELNGDLTVTELARQTRALYHDEDAANRIADHLLQSLHAGRFSKARTPQALAEALNADVAESSKDLHFMIVGSDMGSAMVPPTQPHSATKPLNTREIDHLQLVNFGIAAAEILPGNVGRLDIRQFYRPVAQVRAKYAAAMGLLSDTSGLIVDLSRNPGGDPLTVAHVLSYFFDRPGLVLNRLYWRNHPVEEFKTEAQPGGPLYGEKRPLVIQVSGRSYSAAEEFAYDIQAFKRGIVVGQVTGGGANHALPVNLPGGLQAFIPQARAENPVTGTTWEHVGVKPDVAVDGDAAVAAHRQVLKQVAEVGPSRRADRARTALADLDQAALRSGS